MDPRSSVLINLHPSHSISPLYHLYCPIPTTLHHSSEPMHHLLPIPQYCNGLFIQRELYKSCQPDQHVMLAEGVREI